MPVEFLDWTVDDITLRSLLRLPKAGLANERTLMVKGFEGTSFATSSLLAAIDERDGERPGLAARHLRPEARMAKAVR